jgi:phage-related protein
MAATSMRPVRFMGDSREVPRELPDEVKCEIGYALRRVQQGKMPENAKPLKGIAPGVLEIISDFIRRHVQGRVYGEIPESSLRFARVPEEVQTRHCNAET